MTNARIALIVIAGLIGISLGAYLLHQALYLQHTKQALLALAADQVATAERVAEIKRHVDERWTDGRVGVTRDGYVFFYDLHDSHGMDMIADVNTFYFPDERRFLVTRKHFCVDLSKWPQLQNKTAVLRLIAKAP